jgi:copper chaperone CopZ
MRVYWRRLLQRPQAQVVAQQGQSHHLRIEGLVCDLCAWRARRGLLSLPGVKAATVDLAQGSAVVQAEGPLPAEALERAVLATVIFPRLRRLLHRAGRALAPEGRGTAGGAA